MTGPCTRLQSSTTAVWCCQAVFSPKAPKHSQLHTTLQQASQTLAMTSANDTNVAAVIESKGARVTVTTRPVPTPGEGEMLVRNRAIACNPVDWKIQEYSLFVAKYPTVLGSDAAGEVVSVGPSVTHFAPGDRVTGYAGVVYNNDIDHGAWQTYTILPELGSSKLPPSMSFEQGSVFPMGMATAAVGLFHILAVPHEQHPARRGADYLGRRVVGWRIGRADRLRPRLEGSGHHQSPAPLLAAQAGGHRDLRLPRPRGGGQDRAGRKGTGPGSAQRFRRHQREHHARPRSRGPQGRRRPGRQDRYGAVTARRQARARKCRDRPYSGHAARFRPQGPWSLVLQRLAREAPG